MTVSKEDLGELWNDLLKWYEDEDIESAVVAFSGGKDSTLLLDSAMEGVKEVKAVIVDDEIFPEREIEEAVEKAEEMGADHEIKRIDHLNDSRFTSNPEDRCYHCKKEVFEELKKEGRVILEGTNASEVKGHRPGYRAVEEYARAPLLEVGLGEEEIRALLRKRGHDVWDKPSSACLATRFPSGSRLTKEGLKRVEGIEDKILGLGVKQLRVRDLGERAKIEVWPEDMDKIVDNREKIVKWLREEGYEKILLDLEGYRTGSISK